jgi:hypothetical protein
MGNVQIKLKDHPLLYNLDFLDITILLIYFITLFYAYEQYKATLECSKNMIHNSEHLIELRHHIEKTNEHLSNIHEVTRNGFIP